MARRRWDRAEEHDHVLLLADPDDSHREVVVPHLAAVAGRARAAVLGRYPRFEIVAALDGDEALRLATDEVSVAAVDLVLPRRAGLELIQALRARRPDVALLAFTTVAPPSEAVAAVMAGADYFLECRDDTGPEEFEQAIELAIDRRRLTRLIDHSEAEIDAARGRLSQLSGELDRVHPALHARLSPDDLVPFHEAARRYLAASAKLFEGDAQGLAKRLGVSYFSLRRLLARYDVTFPKKPRGAR
jgi:DNA-binding NarL/FixJ family response regulator